MLFKDEIPLAILLTLLKSSSVYTNVISENTLFVFKFSVFKLASVFVFDSHPSLSWRRTFPCQCSLLHLAMRKSSNENRITFCQSEFTFAMKHTIPEFSNVVNVTTMVLTPAIKVIINKITDIIFIIDRKYLKSFTISFTIDKIGFNQRPIFVFYPSKPMRFLLWVQRTDINAFT